jgi:hypothetical protein
MLERKSARKKWEGADFPAHNDKKRKEEAESELQTPPLQQERTQGQEQDKRRLQQHLSQPQHRFVSLAVRGPLILSRAEFDANEGAARCTVQKCDTQQPGSSLEGSVCDEQRGVACDPPPPIAPCDAAGAAHADARKKVFRIPMTGGGAGTHALPGDVSTPCDAAAQLASSSSSSSAAPLDPTAATARLLVSSGLHITPGSKFGCNWLA